jgi:hypothetical protein
MHTAKMPDWLRDVLIGVSAFVGGRAVNVLGSQIQEGREMRRGFDRLTTAVENIGSDLKEIRVEIHNQVAGLKLELHDQISGVRMEIREHKREADARIGEINGRMEGVNGRIDALAAGMGATVGPLISARARAKLRLNQEMGCSEPAFGDEGPPAGET